MRARRLRERVRRRRGMAFPLILLLRTKADSRDSNPREEGGRHRGEGRSMGGVQLGALAAAAACATHSHSVGRIRFKEHLGIAAAERRRRKEIPRSRREKTQYVSHPITQVMHQNQTEPDTELFCLGRLRYMADLAWQNHHPPLELDLAPKIALHCKREVVPSWSAVRQGTNMPRQMGEAH